MVPLMVIFLILAFITADVLVRFVAKRLAEAKLRKQRAEALHVGLKLEFADEAKSLKRVTVDNPKASILAVDDEAIILDSFRKILVLAGYAVDTVENGKEALALVKKHAYDFVFTDLKMPEMDGLDVTKAVKHLRPDIDVIMITGYGTIESAVDAMKYGALDYVQKPFTEDELVAFVDKSLFRRQDKLEKQKRPKVHLVTPSAGEFKGTNVYNVPAGIFIAPSHTWVQIEVDGMVKIGIDDFAHKTIGSIDNITLPKHGLKITKGEPLFGISQQSRQLTFPSPVSGTVAKLNHELTEHADLLKVKPYEIGWICCVEPSDLEADIAALKIGAKAVTWYQEEIDKFQDTLAQLSAAAGDSGNGAHGSQDDNGDISTLAAFSKSFLNS